MIETGTFSSPAPAAINERGYVRQPSRCRMEQSRALLNLAREMHA
jgi:hypothetical protein